MNNLIIKEIKPALKILFVLCLFVGTIALQAQYVESAGGIFHQSASFSVYYTFAEPVISIYAGIKPVLATESRQSNITNFTLNNLQESDLNISVFPNPAADFIKLRSEMDIIAGMHYQLYNLNGILLQYKQITGNETDISLTNLSPSIYFIKVIEGKKEVKTFKIVKF